MFAFLTASALSQELQVGSHFIDVYQPIECTYPSDATGQYVYITQDLFSNNPNIEIHDSGYKISLNPAKGNAVHYSLFKIPKQNAIVVLNEMSKNKWTIKSGQVVIAIFSKPVSCKVEGSNLLTSNFDLTGSGTESDSYFFGSQIIAIKNSGSSDATATFNFVAVSDSKGIYYTENKIVFPDSQTNYTNPTDTVHIYHPGVYSASSVENLKVQIENGYSLKCLQCTGDTGSNPFTLNKVDNTDAISFLVYKSSGTDIVLIPGKNNTKYLWNSYDQGQNKYNNRDSKTYYFVSDSPFTLKYSRTSDTEVAFADTFDTTSPTFVSITATNDVSIYGQFIGLQIKGKGVFFISKMSVDVKQNIQSISTLSDQNIKEVTDDYVIIGKSGLSPYNLAANTKLVISSGCVVYYSSSTGQFQNSDKLQTNVNAEGEYYICAYNTADTAVVTGNPNNAIFSTSKTKKILFISGSQPTSFRSLREQTTKTITYYSSSTARIDALPLTATRFPSLSKIENAVAVYLEEIDPNQLAFGFTESSGYQSTQQVTIQALKNPKIISSSFYYTTTAEDKDKEINLIPTSSKKNVLVLMNHDQFGLERPVVAFTTITTVTPKDANLIYGVALLDNNIDRISLVINPPEYKRMTVPQGNCAIIVISSNTFKISNPPVLRAEKTNDKFQTYTGSDTYIDFITGSGNPEYVNLDNSKPALVDYDPVWNPSTNFNGTNIKEGRYDFQLTSRVQTVSAAASTIVFFVPKSMDQKVVINVINPVDGSKDVKKFDLFKNKILGYYFDTALNIELSGESNLEIYVYKLGFTPSSFEGYVFKRGGSEITSKFGFVGFSNYSLCVIPSPVTSGLYAYDSTTLSGNQIFTSNPFYFTNDASTTVKYQLKRADTNDPEEAEFTITASDNSNEGISSASEHRDHGVLQVYKPESGLSKGQVAGIVVAIILFIIIDVAIVVLVCYCRKHEPKPQFNFEEEEDALQGDIGADPDGGDVQAGPDVPEDAPAEEAPAN